MEFLKIDLDDVRQPAIVRLKDQATLSGDITVTQTRFSTTGAVVARLSTDKKPREFFLTPDEMDRLCDAWMDYRGAIIQHAREIEERKQNIIAEAKALAKSFQFDLDSLNVRAKRDGDHWHVVVTAIGYETYCNTENLKDTVQMALDRIKSDVESAENWHWHGEWDSIVASYRRVFPLENCHFCNKLIDARDIKVCGPEENQVGVCDECRSHTQLGEPAKITQARALLKEALHLTDWTVCAVYPGTTNDCWSFDNGLNDDKHVAFLNKPAAELLELVSQYITETKHEQGESDDMIAGFWARYRFTTEQAPELSALPE